MNRGPDARVVAGIRSRYSCRDLAEVNAHLAGIGRWLARTLPTQSPERQRRIRAQFLVDINALLDAKIMLAALATLEDDLNALTVPA